MADHSLSRPAWGTGRIAFVARLDTIRAEIGQGQPLTTIYDRHKAALGIGYSGFCKLVARYADDAKLLRQHPSAVEGRTSFPAPALPASPVSPVVDTRAHARHDPIARPNFKHHGIVQEGEPDQLFGPGFLPKRRD